VRGKYSGATMTKPTLTVVGKAEPVVADDSDVKHAEEVAAKIVEAAKAGFGFFAFIDGEEPLATFGGDLLEMACTAEEAARDCKRVALGFSVE
jgi:hypothetical protein